MEVTLKPLQKYLDQENVFYYIDHLMKWETYFKKGGLAHVYITPQSVEHLIKAIHYLRNNNIEYKVIGFTSNILLFDEIEYSVLISTKNMSDIKFPTSDTILIDAGYSLEEFVRIALLHQAKGFEGLEGIPGSIGGGVIMNAGAYGYNISDKLISVECIDPNNEIVTLSKEDCNFNYRNSIFKESKYIVLRVLFQLEKGNVSEIARNIEVFHIARHSYQDFVYPNLGSIISAKGDIYGHIFAGNFLFKNLNLILRVICKNPISKFILRKRPNNMVFNRLFRSYLYKNFGLTLKQPSSNKALNILINDGHTASNDNVSYVHTLHYLLNSKFPIENEFVISPVAKIEPNFNHTFEEIQKVKANNKIRQ